MATKTSTKEIYELREALNVLVQYARGVKRGDQVVKDAAATVDAFADELYSIPDGEKNTVKVVS